MDENLNPRRTLRNSLSDSATFGPLPPSWETRSQKSPRLASGQHFRGGQLRLTAQPHHDESQGAPTDLLDLVRLDRPLSLGTRGPHPEQSPIAQHTNFPPPSSSTVIAQPCFPQLHQSSDEGSLMPPLRQDRSRDFLLSPTQGTTNSVVHARIRNLQRQVDAKTEETTQLRRQLEARENVDIGMLSEQLRAAKHECKTWRERAHVAEKRTAVFERFTERLRGIQASQDVDGGDEVQMVTTWLKGDASPCYDTGDDTDGQRDDRRQASRHTEDGDMVAARIRRSLHAGMDGARSGSEEEMGLPCRHESTKSNGSVVRKISHSSAIEIWMAAQELLRFDADL
jgi:hypothetical protein